MAVFVGVMSGCLDDDNNYNYKQINDLQGGNFNIENINSGYNLIEGDELVLAPTFKFTIDSITPDVSYEWYIDKQLQTGESGATYTFKADKSGTYQVTCMDGRIYRSTYAKFQGKLKRWELTGARSYWKVTAWMPLPEPYKED